jgi:hypothetical protein
MNEAKLASLPKDFKCCQCSIDLPAAMSMVGHKTPNVKKGMIIVCSACGAINVLGDSALHPMTKQEFLALPDTSKRAVTMTRQGILSKIQAGGSWSPHEKN